MAVTKNIHVGVYIACSKSTQLLDMASVDLFAMIDRGYMAPFATMGFIPQSLADKAAIIKISYIKGDNLSETQGSFQTTANLRHYSTHHFTDPEVAPGKLDIVLVPGPDPWSEFDEDSLKTLKQHAANKGTDILSVCTGILVCAAAGLVEGRLACGPRMLQSNLSEKYPDIKFVGNSQRWVRDGNFWSSGKSSHVQLVHTSLIRKQAV
ncbi:hypothetical protein HJFPF1_13002 [Paramyrothecium foliicola]|nr:hypothetical protein HJFPF1_13002 [Paramyrothecium foliicola]